MPLQFFSTRLRRLAAVLLPQVVSLGAGYNHATAVTECGKLYMWGMKVGQGSQGEGAERARTIRTEFDGGRCASFVVVFHPAEKVLASSSPTGLRLFSCAFTVSPALTPSTATAVCTSYAEFFLGLLLAIAATFCCQQRSDTTTTNQRSGHWSRSGCLRWRASASSTPPAESGTQQPSQVGRRKSNFHALSDVMRPLCTTCFLLDSVRRF